MNKNIIIGIVLVAIIALGGYFILNGENNAETDSNPATTNEESMIGNDDESFMENFSGSMKDLLAAGRTLQCTFSSELDGEVSNGEVYVQGDNMRGTFTSSSDGETFSANMIRKGDTVYTWSDLSEEGVMMNIAAYENEGSDVDSMEYDTDVYSQDSTSDPFAGNYEYDCSPWVPNSAMFNPPEDVQFVDLNAQMEQMQQEVMDNIEGVGGDVCSVCDALPTPEAVQQCKTQAGC